MKTVHASQCMRGWGTSNVADYRCSLEIAFAPQDLWIEMQDYPHATDNRVATDEDHFAKQLDIRKLDESSIEREAANKKTAHGRFRTDTDLAYRFSRFRISDNSLRIATVLTSSGGNPAARSSVALPLAMRLSSLLRAPLIVNPCS